MLRIMAEHCELQLWNFLLVLVYYNPVNMLSYSIILSHRILPVQM